MNKVDIPGYRGLHNWVERELGKPSVCDHCGTTSAKRYHWANASGGYLKDLSDWIRLCVSCHWLYDHNNMCRKLLHEITDDNVYIIPTTGNRQCLACKRNYRKLQYKRFKENKHEQAIQV